MSPSGTISEAMVESALDAAGHRSTEYSRKWMRAAITTGGAETWYLALDCEDNVLCVTQDHGEAIEAVSRLHDYELGRVEILVPLSSSPVGEMDGPEEIEIDRLRIAAFKSNSPADRDAYFKATSKWFQDRHYRRHTPSKAFFQDFAGNQPFQERIMSGETAQALKDIEACLDEAVSYLVDLAGAKPDKHSPNNCRVKIDEARFYARHLASLKVSQEAEVVKAQPVAFVDAKGNLLIPDGSPLPEMLGMLGDDPFGEVQPLFATPQPSPEADGDAA